MSKSNEWRVLRVRPSAPSATRAGHQRMRSAFDNAISPSADASCYTGALDFNPYAHPSETSKTDVYPMPSILESRVCVLESNTMEWIRRLSYLEGEIKRESSNMHNRLGILQNSCPTRSAITFFSNLYLLDFRQRIQ